LRNSDEVSANSWWDNYFPRLDRNGGGNVFQAFGKNSKEKLFEVLKKITICIHQQRSSFLQTISVNIMGTQEFEKI
jgi:hypothetical protein